MAFSSSSRFPFLRTCRSFPASQLRRCVNLRIFWASPSLIRVRRYLFTHYTLETLLNHVFEDLRKPKAPNNSRVRTFDSSKYSKCLFLSKVGLLWGEGLIMGKGGVFELFDQSLLKYLSLCFNMCVWLRDRKLSLICKNKPSGGKGWSIYAKIESK